MVMGNNKLKSFRQFLTEEDGMGTVEVILIIVVLVGLVKGADRVVREMLGM